MKVSKLSLLQMTWSEPIEIVLQNGLSNYNGCEDSWIQGAFLNENNEKDKNYGDETQIKVFWGYDGTKETTGST